LDRRVKDQENRLARWQDFGKTFAKNGTSSPTKKDQRLAERKGIDLAFDQHQALQIGQASTVEAVTISGISLEEYTRLIENMRSELADVGKPKAKNNRPRQSLLLDKRRSIVPSSPPPKEDSPTAHDEEWPSTSNTEDISPGFNATKSTSQTPPSDAPATGHRQNESVPDHPAENQKAEMPPLTKVSRPKKHEVTETISEAAPTQKARSRSPPKQSRTPPPPEVPILDTEADQILNSITVASPSPTKKPRHTLSLAERTRLSMSRVSHSQYSDMHDDYDNLADLPSLSRRKSVSPTKNNRPETEKAEKHADLIERTRKSMAGFEAAQKKAQIERRTSQKEAKRRETECRKSYFPKVEEEAVTPEISAIELIEGDPDYESVFKSRPKIKTSPAVSPERSRV
jgi:hypothetical protein